MNEHGVADQGPTGEHPPGPPLIGRDVPRLFQHGLPLGTTVILN